MDALAWAGIIFGLSLAVGIVAPIAGVGGGVLFVPIARAFLPFHIDFVSGAGLILALTSALSASPRMIREGLANLSAAIPITIVTVLTATLGGLTHLWATSVLPKGQDMLTLALGFVLTIALVVMVRAKRSGSGHSAAWDWLTRAMSASTGPRADAAGATSVAGRRRAVSSLVCFAVIGFVEGMFGMGAGWANVPVLHLVVGTPIKIATGTSMAIIAINDAAAGWVYIAHGAVLPLIVVPGTIGMTIGARIGARLAVRARPRAVRVLVLAILLFAAAMNILRGLEGLGFAPSILP